MHAYYNSSVELPQLFYRVGTLDLDLDLERSRSNFSPGPCLLVLLLLLRCWQRPCGYTHMYSGVTWSRFDFGSSSGTAQSQSHSPDPENGFFGFWLLTMTSKSGVALTLAFLGSPPAICSRVQVVTRAAVTRENEDNRDRDPVRPFHNSL